MIILINTRFFIFYGGQSKVFTDTISMAVTLGTVNVSCFKWLLFTIKSKTKGR